MENLPTLNKRIKDFIYFKHDSNVSKFAEFIGTSPQKVNRLFNIDKRTGKYPNPLKTDIISSMLKKYPDLSDSWLLTGEGEMIKLQGKSLDANFEKKDDQWQMVQEESENYMNDVRLAYHRTKMIDINHMEEGEDL